LNLEGEMSKWKRKRKSEKEMMLRGRTKLKQGAVYVVAAQLAALTCLSIHPCVSKTPVPRFIFALEFFIPLRLLRRDPPLIGVLELRSLSLLSK